MLYTNTHTVQSFAGVTANAVGPEWNAMRKIYSYLNILLFPWHLYCLDRLAPVVSCHMAFRCFTVQL